MRKILTIIATMIMCNAYGEKVIWFTSNSTTTTTSCTNGGNIAKPTNPTKSGYRFMGWATETTESDIPRFVINLFSNTERNASYQEPNSTGTSPINWVTKWPSTPSGSVRGVWLCSSTAGSTTSDYSYPILETGSSPSATAGNYCWCKIDAFCNYNKDICASVSGMQWVRRIAYSDGTCSTKCANTCASNCKTVSAFRKDLLMIKK